jgi:hypothetical protein
VCGPLPFSCTLHEMVRVPARLHDFHLRLPNDKDDADQSNMRRLGTVCPCLLTSSPSQPIVHFAHRNASLPTSIGLLAVRPGGKAPLVRAVFRMVRNGGGCVPQRTLSGDQGGRSQGSLMAQHEVHRVSSGLSPGAVLFGGLTGRPAILFSPACLSHPLAVQCLVLATLVCVLSILFFFRYICVVPLWCWAKDSIFPTSH